MGLSLVWISDLSQSFVPQMLCYLWFHLISHASLVKIQGATSSQVWCYILSLRLARAGRWSFGAFNKIGVLTIGPGMLSRLNISLSLSPNRFRTCQQLWHEHRWESKSGRDAHKTLHNVDTRVTEPRSQDYCISALKLEPRSSYRTPAHVCFLDN